MPQFGLVQAAYVVLEGLSVAFGNRGLDLREKRGTDDAVIVINVGVKMRMANGTRQFFILAFQTRLLHDSWGSFARQVYGRTSREFKRNALCLTGFTEVGPRHRRLQKALAGRHSQPSLGKLAARHALSEYAEKQKARRLGQATGFLMCTIYP